MMPVPTSVCVPAPALARPTRPPWLRMKPAEKEGVWPEATSSTSREKPPTLAPTENSECWMMALPLVLTRPARV